MKNDYQEMMTEVKVPQALLDDVWKNVQTLQEEMLEESSANLPPKAKVLTFSTIAKAILPLAAAFLLVIGGINVYQANTKLILTPLTAGTHSSFVELNEGQLTFTTPSVEGTLIPAPSFGGMSLVKKTMEINTFVSQYSAEDLLHYPKGYDQVNVRASAYYATPASTTPEQAVAVLELSDTNQQLVTLTLSTSPLPLGDVFQEPSQVNEKTVYVAYLEDNQEYLAGFEKNEQYYYLQGLGITQEEFILILDFYVNL